MQQPSMAVPPGPQRRGSQGAGDGEHDAQENTPVAGSGKQQYDQQQQLDGSSYLWQHLKSPPPPLQQQQQDQVSLALGAARGRAWQLPSALHVNVCPHSASAWKPSGMALRR